MSNTASNQNDWIMPDHLYRNGVGIMMINHQKKIFVGKRIDNKSDAWQMPQGGIDNGEDEDLAMIRELNEETGVNSSAIKVIAKTKNYLYYNLPYNLQKKFWGGKYLGQKQRWYIVEFIGDDSLINIKTNNAEFAHWKWVSKEDLIKLIVNFKKSLYQKIVKEFENYL
jgi:putative (di)nucleoside polyphosphate hydrolase